jgi:hypothetical protein
VSCDCGCTSIHGVTAQWISNAYSGTYPGT